MIVIGLTGKAGAGKSTVADHLVEAHGFTKLSFAGPLKKMLRTLDPVLDGRVRLSDCEGWPERQIKVAYPEYRRLLQVLGTDCIRAVDEGFWVRAATQQLTDKNGKYVFDDVRFPNEAEGVLGASRGGANVIWHIKRLSCGGGGVAHESEEYAGKMGETLTITNYSSDIKKLHKQVDHLVKMYELDGAAA